MYLQQADICSLKHTTMLASVDCAGKGLNGSDSLPGHCLNLSWNKGGESELLKREDVAWGRLSEPWERLNPGRGFELNSVLLLIIIKQGRVSEFTQCAKFVLEQVGKGSLWKLAEVKDNTH